MGCPIILIRIVTHSDNNSIISLDPPLGRSEGFGEPFLKWSLACAELKSIAKQGRELKHTILRILPMLFTHLTIPHIADSLDCNTLLNLGTFAISAYPNWVTSSPFEDCPCRKNAANKAKTAPIDSSELTNYPK